MRSPEPTTKYVEDMTEEELFAVVENKLDLDPKIIQDAKNGDLEAKYKIAENYFDKRRHPHAKAWCTNLSSSHFAKGQVLMGKTLNEEDMDCCDETIKLVEEWFEKAHANDPVEAAYEIGEYYEYNYRKEMALKWYMRSGETGHKVAQYRVGSLLNNEDDGEYSPIKVDKHKSLEWYQRSADQGYAEAIRAVEDLNREGYYSVAKLKSNLTMLV